MTELAIKPSMTAKAIPILGGILAIVSAFLPWWSASSNSGLSINFSLLTLYSLSRGISLTPSAILTLQPELANTVSMWLVFVILGGILAMVAGIASGVGAVARVCGAVGVFLIAVAVAGFLRDLVSLGNGTWILSGEYSSFGLTATWGVSYGLFLAGISAFIILASSGKRG